MKTKMKSTLRVSPWIIMLLVMCVFTFKAKPAEAWLVAAYNETADNATRAYWPYSIGYLWDAPIDFSLTRIETKFASGSERVTIAVYDDLPQSGGTILTSAQYDVTGGLWGGADLDPVPMVAGQDYFISFWNVKGLGVIYTVDAGTELFSSDGCVYYDGDLSPPPSFTESYFGHSNAIIRIYGVPEPATLCLLGLGVLLLRRRKYA